MVCLFTSHGPEAVGGLFSRKNELVVRGQEADVPMVTLGYRKKCGNWQVELSIKVPKASSSWSFSCKTIFIPADI